MMAAEVPADGPVRLGAVQLPDGKRISEGNGAPPRLWATREPVRDAGRVWHELADMHPATGLVPILLAFLTPWADWGRPWDNGELGPRCDLAEVAQMDAAAVLAEQWWVPAQAELESDPELAVTVAPYGEQFPAWRRPKSRR